jgi:hypothetical protein
LTSVVLLTCTTCKKIAKYPDNIYGEWKSLGGCQTHIIINTNGKGEYGSLLKDKGCADKTGASGKVRFNDSHLYIGLTKFTFVTKPTRLSGTDSIDACLSAGVSHWSGGCSQKYPKLATMTLRNSKFHTGQTVTYYKLVDY